MTQQEVPPVPQNIHEAIHAVMKQVGYVQKQESKGLNYTYTGERALIQALRPWMVECGIYCHVSNVLDIELTTYTTGRGQEMQLTSLIAVVRFVHVPSQTFIESLATGEGADVGDKSLNKALTGALKYALRQTFLIETGDDPDEHASVERAPRGPGIDRVMDGGGAARYQDQGATQEQAPPCKKCGATQSRSKSGNGYYCRPCWQESRPQS